MILIYLETLLYKIYNIVNMNTKTYYKKNNKFNNPIIQNTLYKYNYKPLPDINNNKLNIPNTPNLYIPDDYNNIELELYNLDKGNIFFSNIFAISGCDILCGKDTLWNCICKYYGREKTKNLIPDTYIAYSSEDISSFKTHFTISKKHYILKKNIQRKRGICFIQNEKIENILETVSKYNYKIIQKYIEPVIIKTNMDTLRLYVLIICNNIDLTKQMLLYKYGKCVYTGETLISSSKPFPDSLYDLQQYLGKVQYDIIFHNIVRKLFMIFEAIKYELCKPGEQRGRIQFQLFGVDILLEKESYEPYILEFNKQPEMRFKSEYDAILKPMLYDDIFNLLETDLKIAQNNNNDIYNSNWINICNEYRKLK